MPELLFFFSSRRRHTRYWRDWSSDVCSSDLAKLTVFVFQDDNPLNGENDAGGGVDVLAPNEPGLGGFEIKLFDQAGGLGDNTGQITYDMFNQPVSNSLANHIDPITGLDACPIP